MQFTIELFPFEIYLTVSGKANLMTMVSNYLVKEVRYHGKRCISN